MLNGMYGSASNLMDLASSRRGLGHFDVSDDDALPLTEETLSWLEKSASVGNFGGPDGLRAAGQSSGIQGCFIGVWDNAPATRDHWDPIFLNTPTLKPTCQCQFL